MSERVRVCEKANETVNERFDVCLNEVSLKDKLNTVMTEIHKEMDRKWVDKRETVGTEQTEKERDRQLVEDKQA